MGSVGDCFDIAMCEGFFASLECELHWQHSFRSRQEATLAIFDFIEDGAHAPAAFCPRLHAAFDL